MSKRGRKRWWLAVPVFTTAIGVVAYLVLRESPPRSTAELVAKLRLRGDLPPDAVAQVPAVAASQLGYGLRGNSSMAASSASQCYRTLVPRLEPSIKSETIRYDSVERIGVDFSTAKLDAKHNAQVDIRLEETFVRKMVGIFDDSSSCREGTAVITWEWGAKKLVMSSQSQTALAEMLTLFKGASTDLHWTAKEAGTIEVDDVVLAVAALKLETKRSELKDTILVDPIEKGTPINLPQGTPGQFALKLASFSRAKGTGVPLFIFEVSGAHNVSPTCVIVQNLPMQFGASPGDLCVLDFHGATSLSVRIVQDKTTPAVRTTVTTQVHRSIESRVDAGP